MPLLPNHRHRDEDDEGFYSDWPENDQDRAAGCFDTCCLLVAVAFFLLMLLVGAGGCVAVPEPQSGIAVIWSGGSTPPCAERERTERAIGVAWASFQADNGRVPDVQRLEVLHDYDEIPWADKRQTGWCFFGEGRIVICAKDPMVLYHELGHLLIAQDNRNHIGPWWERWESRTADLARRWSWSF